MRSEIESTPKAYDSPWSYAQAHLATLLICCKENDRIICCKKNDRINCLVVCYASREMGISPLDPSTAISSVRVLRYCDRWALSLPQLHEFRDMI